jgi:carboxymethylenebutenolidase
MRLDTSWVRFGDGDRWSGYLAAPSRATAPMPAVVLFQEAWGVDAHIEDVASRFSTAGYVVLAPDLFAEHGRRRAGLDRESLGETQRFLNSTPPAVWHDAAARERALADQPVDQARRIGATLGTLFGPGGPLGAAQHLPIGRAAVAFLIADLALTRGAPVASIGFCMGGAVAGLLGCHEPALRLSVIFYGTSPPAELAPQACPMLGFYGGADDRVNATVPPFAAAMAAAGVRFETETYPGVQHAFFNDTRPSYDLAASRDALARTLMALRAL